MKKLFLSIVVLFAGVSAFAQDRVSLIQSEMLLPVPSLLRFDGHDFGMTDAQLKKDLASFGKVDVNLKDKSVQTSNGKFEYKMTWKNEEFEHGSDLRLNQISAIKKYNSLTKTTENNILLTTNTFNGKYLRSSTICEGAVVNSDGAKSAEGAKSVNCATATKEVCKRVLAAYRKNDNLRTPGVPTQESKKAADAKVNSCLKTMEGYSEVLKAFSQTYTGNAGVEANHKEIVAREKKEIDNVLSTVKSNAGYFSSNHINTMTGDDFAKTADTLTSTMAGLKQVNDFVDVCNSHEGDFAPDATIGGGASGTTSRANR